MDEMYSFIRKKTILVGGLLASLLTGRTAMAQCLLDLTDAQPYSIAASGAMAGYAGTRAFDNNDQAYSGWKQNTNPSAASSAWLRINFSAAQLIKGYSITAIDDGSGTNNIAPANWRLQGSTNGSTWITLDTRSGEVFTGRGETHIYSFSNSTAYQYYRLLISETYLTSSNYVGVGEMQLFADVCLTGTVFKDNGDRASAYGAGDAPLPGVKVSIVTSPVGNVVATTTTNAVGQYSFNASAVPAVGSFSVMVRPPAGKIFVTRPANLWSTWVTLPNAEDEPPTGSVFFGYHLAPNTFRPAAVNRMRFAGGALDFGLQDAQPPAPFTCLGSSGNINLIVEGGGGTMGVSAYN